MAVVGVTHAISAGPWAVHRTLRPDPSAKKGCCFNYWWNDARAPHGVANLTRPSPPDDAAYLADAFVRFLERQRGAPFLAQISFHNCHVPFVGTAARRAACAGGAACAPPLPGAAAYSDDELDFYACLTELDHAVGAVLVRPLPRAMPSQSVGTRSPTRPTPQPPVPVCLWGGRKRT